MNKKTYKYFKDRERKYQEEKIKDDEKFSKVLEKEYQRTLREIDNRINWWIGKYADDNEIYIEQAKQIVAEADVKELKEKAKEYVRNKDLSPRANKEMRIYNLKMKVARDELLQKYIDLELAKLGTKEEKLLEDRIFNESIEELERQSGILGKNLISNSKMKTIAQQIVNDSHVSAHFSYYIWTNIKELRNDLQNGLNRSILRGQNPNVWKSDLYKHFKGRVQKAEFAARRLAITETAIAQTKAGLLSTKENGYDKVIVITEPGACKHCKPHDGNIVDIDKAEMGKNVPIWHPFCRCTVSAYYENDDGDILRDDLNKFDGIVNKKDMDSIGEIFSKEKYYLGIIKEETKLNKYLFNKKVYATKYDLTRILYRHGTEITKNAMENLFSSISSPEILLKHSNTSNSEDNRLIILNNVKGDPSHFTEMIIVEKENNHIIHFLMKNNIRKKKILEKHELLKFFK